MDFMVFAGFKGLVHTVAQFGDISQWHLWFLSAITLKLAKTIKLKIHYVILLLSCATVCMHR